MRWLFLLNEIICDGNYFINMKTRIDLLSWEGLIILYLIFSLPTSSPDSHRAFELWPHGHFDHAEVSVDIYFHPPISQEIFLLQTNWLCLFRDILSDVTWNVIFNLTLENCATDFSSWGKVGIEYSVPARKY